MSSRVQNEQAGYCKGCGGSINVSVLVLVRSWWSVLTQPVTLCFQALISRQQRRLRWAFMHLCLA